MLACRSVVYLLRIGHSGAGMLSVAFTWLRDVSRAVCPFKSASFQQFSV